MLAGLPQEALSQYLIAGEHLRVVNDLLWLAGALEGQCAASLLLTKTATEKDRNSLILPIECAANSMNLTMNGLGGDVDESKFRNPQALSEDEIVERLSEALRLYNRVSIHTLHTVLCIFTKVLTRRICLTIKVSQVGDHLFYSHDINMWFSGDMARRN